MTPDRFRDCLALLRWTQRGLADALECDDRLVRRWASGDADIPSSVAAWLETLGKVHATLPPPKGWRRWPEARDRSTGSRVAEWLPNGSKETTRLHLRRS